MEGGAAEPLYGSRRDVGSLRGLTTAVRLGYSKRHYNARCLSDKEMCLEGIVICSSERFDVSWRGRRFCGGHVVRHCAADSWVSVGRRPADVHNLNDSNSDSK